ncbi:transport system permease protein [Methanotorris formicicus Mc-S-70]|uniref:Transport system permease protein n=2 Tax=Methanotorris formicicus TaxID=213185 RepID=H1KWW0_9EURY|nr:transport system permease protein [Methanotorris formicicus Mc-S-70]
MVLIILILTLIFTGFLSLFLGTFPMSPKDVIDTILGENVSDTYNTVIYDIRLPRILFAIIVGSGLSVAGAVYQSTFKNPLVSPYILGTSSGSAFGAALAILLNQNIYIIQISAFIFGIMATLIAYLLAREKGRLSILSLVICGVIVNSFFQALLGITKYFADTESQLPSIIFWIMGSFSGVDWDSWVVLAIIIVGISILCAMRWHLNVMSMSDEEARSLGIDIDKSRKIIIFMATLITASAVSVVGIVGWVGLVIPHISRLIVGVDNTKVIPTSILLGGIFLLITDDLARTITTGEVPIGILTSFVGAPFFAYLYHVQKKAIVC